jgi:hypothetical protein
MAAEQHKIWAEWKLPLEAFRGEYQFLHLLGLAFDVHRLTVERHFHTSGIAHGQADLFLRVDSTTLLRVENTLPDILSVGED